MKVNGNEIYITRGDSESFEVSLFDMVDDVKRELIEGEDVVYFTVKTSTQTMKKTFQKIINEFQDGKAIVNIDPEDTKELRYGNYYYDVQLITNGSVKTVIPPAMFVVQHEVTYE